MDPVCIAVLEFSAVFFCAMVVSLAARPRFVSRLTCAAALVTGVGGLLTYSYGYALTGSSAPLAIIRTVTATCGMFLGRSDFSAVKGTPFFSTAAGEALFYLLHLIAMYATASAAITTVGAALLQRLRMFLSRWGRLVLIYGVHEDSVDFGKALSTRKGNTVVYIGEPAPGCASRIQTSSGVLRTDAAALSPGRQLLRSLGIRPGKRQIFLYALSRDQSENLSYATALLQALEAGGIRPEQTHLFLLSTEEEMQALLQNTPAHYGYGNVCVMDRAEMAARLLVRQYPPVQTLRFDGACRANEDLTCLILGFGKIGQAVLQQLVMHGQFLGSTFRATVFDPKCSQISGGLLSRSPQLLTQYKIDLVDADARSTRLYQYLNALEKGPKYLVVCTGSSRNNEEIAFDLLNYFSRRGIHTPIYLCEYSGVRRFTGTELPVKHPLFCPDVLVQHSLDQMGMALNQVYCGANGKSSEANWAECSPFNRMSSRAAADFMPAFLHISSTPRLTAMQPGGWSPDEAQLENLSMTEHLRWNAFHYVMGYSPMSRETFHRRGRLYLENLAAWEAEVSRQFAKGTPEFQAALKARSRDNIRIAKDPVNRQHACLVPWEELDELSARERAITGNEGLDYKRFDADNVLALPQVLLATATEEELQALAAERA